VAANSKLGAGLLQALAGPRGAGGGGGPNNGPTFRTTAPRRYGQVDRSPHFGSVPPALDGGLMIEVAVPHRSRGREGRDRLQSTSAGTGGNRKRAPSGDHPGSGASTVSHLLVGKVPLNGP